MEKNKIDWIISMIREEMTTGSTAGAPGFSGSSDPKGPPAGFDPVMKFQRRFFKGKRKQWLDYLKNK